MPYMSTTRPAVPAPANPDANGVYVIGKPLTERDGSPMKPRTAAELRTIVVGPPELVRALVKLSATAACSCGYPIDHGARDAAGIGLCEFCYEESGFENSLSDGHMTTAEFDAAMAELRAEHGRTEVVPSDLDEFGDPTPAEMERTAAAMAEAVAHDVRVIQARDDSFNAGTGEQRTHADDVRDATAPARGNFAPFSGPATAAAHAAHADRRTGADRRQDDRRAPVPSPTGDRRRQIAETLDALANTAADHAGYGTSSNASYASGAEDAYRAAARMVAAFAATEDIR
jgi:hypothetical protein